MTVARREMSLAEWADLDEDEEGELVDDLLEEDEEVTFLHEFVVSQLHRTLDSWARENDGAAFLSGLKFAVSRRSGRKADLSVFFRRDRPRANDNVVTKPPVIVVEVLSSRPRDERRDRVDKAHDYAAFGVPSLWIVNPVARILEVKSLVGAAYETTCTASEGAVDVPGFDGLSVDLDALWSATDAFFADEPES